MVRRTLIVTASALALAGAVMTAGVRAGFDDTRVAEAASRGDRDAVRDLLKTGAEVNGAEGDGMTALHWAAMKDDVEMARMLIAAGANLDARTRLGEYTPVILASQNGSAAMLGLLLGAGADARVSTTAGTSALMFASAAGNLDAIRLLLDRGANINAREYAMGVTPLMFAAANNRPAAITLLVARGADIGATTDVVDLAALAAAQRAARGGRGGRGGGRGARGAAGAAPPDPQAAAASAARTRAAQAAGLGGSTELATPPRGQAAGQQQPPDPQQAQTYQRGQGRGGGGGGGGGNNNGDDSTSPPLDYQGGLTPLLYAARQGHLEAARALLDAGANINEVSPGDRTSPLLIATVNAHFDLAMYLLEHGANPNLASTANATPLYAALNVQWAPHAFYPQPNSRQEKTTYLQLMQALLDHGADPNVRLSKKLWYTGYNFDQSGVDARGSTPFWRACQASDLPAMKMLVAHGADPTIPSESVQNMRLPNGRSDAGDGAEAAPPRLAAKIVDGVTPLQMASGAGYDGNFQVIAPSGMMAAVKYLVEELHADVNEADYRGYTPIHNAAFRGDNEMIQYLISKGADVMVETKSGDTAVDMANGPVQRLQPFPETIKLLEALGVPNHHRCKSCLP
jgi:ankyrin repeat protein